MRYVVLAVLALAVAAPAGAQPKSTEAGSQSSNMGPPAGDRSGASNGVGTAGSITGNEGKATSSAATTGFNAQGSNRGAGGTMENDPALGGGQQHR
jgi:hypothetical protein